MASGKKLFLLDAMALIYRAYFAFSNNHRINSKGQNTSAVFGFTNTLLDVLKKEQPSHIAVVFDTAAPTTRHEEFSDYKAGREEIPEDLASAIPVVVKLCEAFRIPVLAVDGYEADDVIGTLALRAEQEGFETYMMTPDKDYGQLVDEHTFIYKPARSGIGAEVMGVKEICAKWEIERVDQLKDILGLMGDKVDNIPGIPGVGEKTAIALIKQFGSMENLLENTDQLKGKLKEKVEANKDKATQSKWLATIITDVPLDVELDELKAQESDKEALSNLFAELEFRRLADQLNLTSTETEPIKKKSAKPEKVISSQATLFGTDEVEEDESFEDEPEAPAPSSLKNIKEVEHHYELVDTPETRKKRLDSRLKHPVGRVETTTSTPPAWAAPSRPPPPRWASTSPISSRPHWSTAMP